MTNKYHIGQILTLVTDVDKHKRIVTQVNFSILGIQYELVFGSSKSWHYEFEIGDSVPEKVENVSIGFKHNNPIPPPPTPPETRIITEGIVPERPDGYPSNY